MGGRLIDWLGQGLQADRPVAATVVGLTSTGGAALYYGNDAQILSVYDDALVDWLEIDVNAIASLAFQSLADVDWTTPPTDGQVFVWDTGSSKLIPYSIPPLPTTEELQDVIGAMFANGTGITASYNDGTGMVEINSTITQYTDEMAMDSIAAAFAAGTHSGITVTYDDTLNKYDLAVSTEFIQDTMGTAFAAGTHVGIVVTYTDGSNLFSFTIDEASDSDMFTGTSAAKVVTPNKLFDAAAPVSVSYGATVTLDLNTGINFDIGTLTGNITLANFTNAKAGQSGLIHFVQDGTGSRIITYGSNFRAAAGLAVNGLLSTGINMVDEMSYFVRTDGKIVISILKDVKA